MCFLRSFLSTWNSTDWCVLAPLLFQNTTLLELHAGKPNSLGLIFPFCKINHYIYRVIHVTLTNVFVLFDIWKQYSKDTIKYHFTKEAEIYENLSGTRDEKINRFTSILINTWNYKTIETALSIYYIILYCNLILDSFVILTRVPITIMSLILLGWVKIFTLMCSHVKYCYTFTA